MKVHKQLMIITLTAMLLVASLCVIVPEEVAAAPDPFNGQEILAYYYSDDGSNPGYGSSTKAQNRVFMKVFPDIDVPINSDVIVDVYIIANQKNPFNLTVGNVDDGGHTFDANKRVITTWQTGGTSGWFARYVYEDSRDFLVSGKDIGVAMTPCDAAYPMYYGADTAADTEYKNWYFDGASWKDQTANWTFFFRLGFITSKGVAASSSVDKQLQLGAVVTGSSQYLDWDQNGLSVFRLQDGLKYVSGEGDGWAAKTTTANQWLNFTLKSETIFALGDSITAGHPYHSPNLALYGLNDDVTTAYPYVLGQSLDISIVNRGVGSDTTSGMLARLTADVIDYRPDRTIVLAGINDIGLGSSAATIIANLGGIYSRLIDNGSDVMACTILPAGTLDSAKESILDEVNDWILAQANDHITVVDTFSVFNDPADPYDLLPIYDSGDHVHPSIIGYQKLAEVIFTQGFGSTNYGNTEYEISKIQLETVVRNTAPNIVVPRQIMISYEGGHQYHTMTNATSYVYLTSPVRTSWVNVSILNCMKLPGSGTLSSALPPVGIGEVRIYSALFFVSTPPNTGYTGESYHYTAETIFDGSTYGLSSSPAWLSINATTGEIIGVPQVKGVYNVTVWASMDGEVATQTYILIVKTQLISPSLMNGMIETIIAVMMLVAVVSIIGMVKVKKR